MRWFAFLVLCGLVLTLQTTIAPRCEIGGLRPDWILVIVVFFALHARPRDAILGAWLVGFAADLLTVERLGLLSFSYALAALLVATIREAIFRHEILTQIIVTFAIALTLQVLWTVYRRALYPQEAATVASLLLQGLGSAIYTAAWSPVWHRGLQGTAPLFGLPRGSLSGDR
jgi:rod shape-determining protein MreD